MPHGYFWGTGMWIFPAIGMLLGFTILLLIIFLVFGRGYCRPPWHGPGAHHGEGRETETALDILKKRYARGEISKEDFERIKKDIQS